MSKTLLITMALVAAVTAEPYISALSSLYGPTGPFAYTFPGPVQAPLAPEAAVAAPLAVPTALAAPGPAYAPEFASAYTYGVRSYYNVPNIAPISSAYTSLPGYGYTFGDAGIYRR